MPRSYIYRRAGKFWHDVASRRGALRRLASYCELGFREQIWGCCMVVVHVLVRCTCILEFHGVMNDTCTCMSYRMYKSSLERVSNAVRGCIDGELRHESAMNIILRFLAKYVVKMHKMATKTGLLRKKTAFSLSHSLSTFDNDALFTTVIDALKTSPQFQVAPLIRRNTFYLGAHAPKAYVR